LATDGLWDEFSNAQAVEFVYDNYKNGVSAQLTSKQLCETAFMQGSQDNITTIIVYFRAPQPLQSSI
jgi:protein phosphatase 1L